MNERGFQNKKHLSTGLLSVLRNNILEIRAYALLMAHAKPIAFGAKVFRIP